MKRRMKGQSDGMILWIRPPITENEGRKSIHIPEEVIKFSIPNLLLDTPTPGYKSPGSKLTETQRDDAIESLRVQYPKVISGPTAAQKQGRKHGTQTRS